MPTILGREYENSPLGAAHFQYDLMNPFDMDPDMFALRMAYGTGISTGGFAVASLITGTPMPSMFVQSITRAYGTAERVRNTAAFAARFAPQVAIIGSAVAQREVWQQIGDEKTGAVHFAAAGTMSGGSMPVVSSQDTSSPTGGFTWESIMSLF
jgi:hypothetical protein